MSIENMMKISQAEEEAVNVKKDMQTKAREILEQARKESENLILERRTQAEAAYQEEMQKASKRAEELYDTCIAKTQEECEAMRKAAMLHKKEAVAYILGKVVGIDGNC